jgi:hypothetical protein
MEIQEVPPDLLIFTINFSEPRRYSARSAVTGATRIARRAGR